jgi:hypothetical protein
MVMGLSFSRDDSVTVQGAFEKNIIIQEEKARQGAGKPGKQGAIRNRRCMRMNADQGILILVTNLSFGTRKGKCGTAAPGCF